MNIKQAKEEIKNTIEAYLLKDAYGAYTIPSNRQRPVLLMGPPGVGKTQIMEQIARECKIGLAAYTITHHTRQSAVGLPFIEKKIYNHVSYSVTEYTMSEIVASIYDKIEQTGIREGILFIDEVNCVSETLAPTMLQFLQAKTFGNYKIPEGWVIVAAGNPPEFNKSVREFDVVTLDRLKLIQVEPDFDVWKEYAYAESIHPAIISYLEIKRQYFCQIETTVDGKLFATPRGWEDLSRLIEVYETLKKTVNRDVVAQYIQHGKIAKDFANYLELYYKYQSDYQVEEILKGVIREGLCDRLAKAPFDEKMSVVGLLLSGLSGQFKRTLFQESVAELLMEKLKGYHGKIEMPDGQDRDISAENMSGGSDSDVGQKAVALFDGIIEKMKNDIDQKKAAVLISRGQHQIQLEVLKRLESYSVVLKKEKLTAFTSAWEILRRLFGEERELYESMMEESGL